MLKASDQVLHVHDFLDLVQVWELGAATQRTDGVNGWGTGRGLVGLENNGGCPDLACP
jgi:hypothetical protein